MATNKAMFVSPWTMDDGKRVPAIWVEYPYSYSDVTGTALDLLDSLPLALVAVEFLELTDVQLATMQASSDYLLWTTQRFDDDGSLLSDNLDSAIDISGTLTKLQAWGMTQLPPAFQALVDTATSAEQAGDPLTRGQVEVQVLAALRDPSAS